ncbi:glycosyl hydrolase family 20 [Kineothrix alysoides]|uniref:beta-N-acetylhexosaminidase n=1 Tax=Kineothrix alysoides TaxID=1469948 RepID=A0A4R1R3U9_9FIRM|nr:family 20 glycosylhydrolase [Kineothrix alysoides]TCL60115.1 glycosyl hydrolase family 20 [Kineothrix alysoides]
MSNINLLNYITKYEAAAGYFDYKQISMPQYTEFNILNLIKIIFPEGIEESNAHTVDFEQTDHIVPQGYRLSIKPKSIKVTYNTLSGAAYSLITLKHLAMQAENKIPCGEYIDEPTFPVRGVLYDISRDKVPKLETLLRLTDIIFELKYNQLQLYVEGLTFEYECFKNYLTEQGYLTKQEILTLQEYCKQRFIDLVPNQNTLGHMAPWLAIDDFSPLSKNPEGELAFGVLQPSATLDPGKPESRQFIKAITEEMLSVFNSDNYNVNLDEAFGIQTGEEYSNWVAYMESLCKIYDKNMLMWSDMLNTYPEIKSVLPRNAVLLDWGYEADYPFDMECKILAKEGYKFYVCPGTSAWRSISGRTDNMIKNTDNAIVSAIRYGAEGIIAAEWGDCGHWQTYPIAITGIAYIGLCAWSGKPLNRSVLTGYLNDQVYGDESKQIGDLLYDLGNLYLDDELMLLNGTFAYHYYCMGIASKEQKQSYIKALLDWMIPYAERFEQEGEKEIVKYLKAPLKENYSKQLQFIENQKSKIQKLHLNCGDKKTIIFELYLTAAMLEFSLAIAIYIENPDKSMLMEMKPALEEIIVKFRKNWFERNKSGGLEKSMQNLFEIKNQIENALSSL